MTHVIYKFWLALDRSGTLPRITKNAPGIHVGERAMQCVVTLPKAAFEQPQLMANIQVQQEQMETYQIDIEATETALKGVLGADEMVEVIYPDPEENE